MAKTPLQIASLARSHAESAIRTLAAIMHEPRAPWACRVMAAEALLDRGFGKAPLTIQGEIEHRYVIEVPAELTREQWIKEYSTPLIENNPATP
jgi:hypothetical protein